MSLLTTPLSTLAAAVATAEDLRLLVPERGAVAALVPGLNKLVSTGDKVDVDAYLALR